MRRLSRRKPYVPAPTKPTKAIVAAVLSLLGAVGLTVSDGTTQIITGAVQVLIITYGVWRAVNRPRDGRAGGIGGFL